jgi:endonuclease III
MAESFVDTQNRAVKVFNTLKEHYPPVTTFLTHNNTFELLIAVMLSAQCTDARVNKVTPALFTALPTPQDFVAAELDTIKELIKSINFFNTKAINIQKTCDLLITTFNTQVPNTLESLVSLPGVGRKTANVVLGQAFNIPGITVDTHVNRLCRRLGFTNHTTAEKIEQDTIKLWPEDTWIDYSSLLILHGRETCNARKPKCMDCIIKDDCPSFKTLVNGIN